VPPDGEIEKSKYFGSLSGSFESLWQLANNKLVETRSKQKQLLHFI
jgi:hypothetical protein